MKTEILNERTIEDFKAYCRRHRDEVDDSYLYEEYLANFKISKDDPTYIITNEHGKIAAAASLIMDEYHRKGRNARFRIFHSEKENIECFRSLLDALLAHTAGLKKIFLFIPAENEKTKKLLEKLKFTQDRCAYMLLRDDAAVPPVLLPKEYEIKPFIAGQDEEVWCKVRNASFAKLKGSETPITSLMVADMIKEGNYLEGGMMILTHKNKPVGIVRGSADEYEHEKVMCIGPLAILPEYQGKGLGRLLLRSSLHFAKEHLFERTVLSVNADNDKALALYLQEGFQVKQSVICYQYMLNEEVPCI